MVNISKLTRKRLGELLLSEGMISEEQIQEALRQQQKTGELLGEVLVKLGYVTATDIARIIATQFGLPYIDCSRYFIGKEVLGLFKQEMLQKHQFVPLDRIGGALIIAVSGLMNEAVFTEIERSTGCELHVYVSTWDQVQKVLSTLQPAVAK